MTEDSSRIETTRKPRREAMQIYRPGMFKKGVDSTLGEPSTNSLPPEPPRRNKLHSSPLDSARSTGRIDQVHRRRSNDTDSMHSYHNDSGSTTPDALSICSERRNSGGSRGMRIFTRGGGRSKERRDDTASECSNRSYISNNTRNEPQNNHRRGDSSYRQEEPRTGGYNKPYNSTQSLYNSRIPGGYLDNSERRGDRQGPLRQNLPTGQQRFMRNGQQSERSSMRAETSQRRVPRRRNDSINSTQSEWPQPTQELTVDTGPETQSQAGDALSITSSSMDFFDMCKSLESMGSFNWTEEMEREDAAKQKQNEEEQNKILQKKIEACKNGVELQKTLSENKGRPIKGIMRINIEDGPSIWARTELIKEEPRKEEAKPPMPSSKRDKRRGGRQRRDSDCSSSVSGSIVEEDEENDDDLAPGERTPTDSRPSSSQAFRVYERKPSREREYRQSPRRGPPAERMNNIVPGNSRLAGRVSTVPSRGGVYQPPAMRRGLNEHHQRLALAADAVGSSTSLKNNRDSDDDDDMSKADLIYSQIAKVEGPLIEKLNQEITSLLQNVSERKDVRAAEKLLKLSEKLRTIYLDVLSKDISFTFSKNLEQHLWKQAFHRIIDSMKKGSNSVNSNAKAIRNTLLQFLDESISYYTLLISHIENLYNVSFELALYWSNGLPSDDFSSLLHAERPVDHESPTQKLALKSLSRHLICLGDLFRYKSLVEGNEDYSAARAWYLKASQLWASSGHSYNQLAVVAFFSMLYTSTRRARQTSLEILSKQRQERVLDEIFFFIRAISTHHPYEAAKDRLSARLAAMRKKVEKYEALLDSEQGRIKTELTEIGYNQREHWILPEIEKHAEEPSTSSNPSQLHRRTVSYLIHTAGLLISKIGMEAFASVSERAFTQLNVLLSIEEAPISAHQIIQFTVVFIHAVQINALKEKNQSTSQQELALKTLITYLGSLLKCLVEEDFSKTFSGEKSLSKQSLRVLPAVCLISLWLQSSYSTQILQTMSSIQPLKFTEFKVDTWTNLVTVVNKIPIRESNQIANIISQDGEAFMLPEVFYVSSFNPVFSSSPDVLRVDLPDDTQVDVSTYVRIYFLSQLSKKLAELHLNCIEFNEEKKKFQKVPKKMVQVLWGKQKEPEEQMAKEEESLSREEILARERRRFLLVIKPRYIIPDTNAIIDSLDLLKKIIECGHYEVLIPTIVLDELQGLSKPGKDARSIRNSTEAKSALGWLKEKIKENNPLLNTLTTQGNKVSFRIFTEDTTDRGAGRVNDDLILQSCTFFVEKNPSFAPLDNIVVPKGAEVVYSNLVLLSGDRGICIKASVEHIPTRTIQSFARWSKLHS